MIRNIANVVHDLKPIVHYLKKKALDLPEVEDPKKLMELIEKIQADALMLERYLESLEQNVREAGVVKNIK